jgi:hypothetical protein
MTSRHLRRSAAALAAAAALGAAGLQCAGSASAAEPQPTTVHYKGLTVPIPAGWNVVDLAQSPHTCVRFDEHTVYLGRPGAEQDCPAHLIGPKTDALLLEPFSGATTSAGVPAVTVPAGSAAPTTLPIGDGRDVRVAFEGAGVYATGEYGASRSVIEGIIAAAGLDDTAVPQSVPRKPMTAFTANGTAATASSASFTGKGFESCSAPSSSSMDAWDASPYRGVGIYMGGPTLSCAQPNLTASWVAQRSADGWYMMPIYDGLQAASISSSGAASQGASAADAAVAEAQSLGFASGTVLYDDMEQYSSSYRSNVLSYLSGWSDRLHVLGYRSGVYSSGSSGIADLVSVYDSTTLVRPDTVWIADWNGSATASDPYVPAADWAGHQRIHQYAGQVSETYGGVTLAIDRDYVDVGPGDPGMTDLAAGDLTGDGHADLIGVEVSTGKLWLYKGHADGTIDGGSTRTEIGPGGWNGMTGLTIGDFDGDGKQDVAGVETSTGKLWLYRGHGDGTIDGGSTRTEMGTGWNSMTNLAAGDFDGDGKDDLTGVEVATGKLWLYSGHGDGTIDGGSTRTQLGTGWNSMTKIVSPGDMNGDGKDDLVATENSTGKLWLYRGHGDGTIDGGSTRVEIGSGGWNGISDYAGGDFDGDGVGDLAAVESAPGDTGKLYLYKGTGSGGLGTRTEIGSSGW